MRIHFLQPLYLALLALLPITWWASRSLRSLGPGRKWSARVLRSLIILCLTLALAEAQYIKRSKELTVFYVLDQSDSIPSEQRKQAVEAIQETSKRMKASDNAGLIVFGSEPSIEDSPVKKYQFTGEIRSAVGVRRTDISSALRLALAAFPADVMKRIVLLTDGNENEGSAVDAARFAKGNNIPVDIVPLRYQGRQDVQITKVIAPQQTVKDAPFEVKVFVESQRDTKALLRLFSDNQLLEQRTVQIFANKRKAEIFYPEPFTEGGFHRFRATLEAADDARPENNTAYGFTFVKSRPRVLYIEGDELAENNFLAPALRAMKIDVDFMGISGIPETIEQMQSYDSLILSNIEAGSMSGSQMKLIEKAVHDLGVGLVMIGGDKAFGAGGWQETPIEKALPVSMDVKQKKVLPNGALAIVLHTCEIPSGNSWAREISMAALGVLSRQDMFGLLFWGPPVSSNSGMAGWGENWAWNPGLQQCGDKRKMKMAIMNVQPGDMPSFDPTLKLAYEGLAKVKAEAKHIIIISDGDPGPPQKNLANAVRDAGISISTVAIAPHNGQTVDTLKALALWGGGTFYYPKSSNELPRIFIKEASVVRRSLISEQPFKPLGKQYSEILTGVGELPGLKGHVVTTIKDLATEALTNSKDEGDPVLAHWRYGLGKTVAFTSDAKNKWAAEWVGGSPVFAKFWAQVVRWSMRETASSNFQVQTDISGGKGTVTIDALDDDGNFMNYLQFEGKVITPSFESQTISVRQIAPGRYQAEFPATEVGSYMLSMTSEKDGEKQLATGGAILSYSPEFQVSRSNDPFIETLSRESGGALVESIATYNPFLHNLPSGNRPTPVWPFLAMLGLLLLPFDIFVRRVYVDWEAVGQWIQARINRIIASLRPASAAQAESRLKALKGAKARATKGEADGAEGSAASLSAQATSPAEISGRETQLERDRQAAARAILRRQLEEKAAAEAQSGAQGTSPSVFQAPDATGGQVRHRAKETFTAQDVQGGASSAPGAGSPGGGLAGGLLEAKKRARKKM